MNPTPIRTLLGASLFLSVSLSAQGNGSSASEHGGAYTWHELPSAPFAAADLGNATAGAINNRGDVAGVGSDPTIPLDSRGWILRHGELTVFSAPNPGGLILEVTGINLRGDCVGRYSDGPPTFNSVGFVRRADGTFLSLPTTAGGNPEPEAIGDNGTLVGDFGFQGTNGFVQVGAEPIPLQLPGFVNTTLFDINNRGWLLGRASAGDEALAFLVTPQGVLAMGAPTLPDRDADAPFQIRAINERGELAGSYRSTTVAFSLPLPGGGSAPFFEERAFVRDASGQDRTLEVPYLGSTDDLVVPPGPFGPAPMTFTFGGVSSRQVIDLSNRYALMQVRVSFLPSDPTLPFTLSRTIAMIGERR